MTAQPPPPKPTKKQQIKLHIPANLTAFYVNFSMITHSLSEMIVDFAQVLPNTPNARVQSRIIMTPTNAKQFHKALGESIAKYEAKNGEIKVPPSLADQLFMQFGSPTTDPTDDAPANTAPDDPESDPNE